MRTAVTGSRSVATTAVPLVVLRSPANNSTWAKAMVTTREVHQEWPGSGVGGRHRLASPYARSRPPGTRAVAATDVVAGVTVVTVSASCPRDSAARHGWTPRTPPPTRRRRRCRGQRSRLVTARQAHACQPEQSGCHRDDLPGRCARSTVPRTPRGDVHLALGTRKAHPSGPAPRRSHVEPLSSARARR